jgi:hypothetical protein
MVVSGIERAWDVCTVSVQCLAQPYIILDAIGWISVLSGEIPNHWDVTPLHRSYDSLLSYPQPLKVQYSSTVFALHLGHDASPVHNRAECRPDPGGRFKGWMARLLGWWTHPPQREKYRIQGTKVAYLCGHHAVADAAYGGRVRVIGVLRAEGEN